MRYLLRQNFFSFGDDFTIKDEEGQEVFFVDGRAFSFGKKLSLQDMAGNELAFIEQKLLSWGPTYEIYLDNALAAVVKKEHFTFFNCQFAIDVPGPDDMEASGNFSDHAYQFTRGNQVIAEVSKAWFTLTDSYGVEIAEGEDDVLILACAVVIDMVCHGDRKN